MNKKKPNNSDLMKNSHIPNGMLKADLFFSLSSDIEIPNLDDNFSTKGSSVKVRIDTKEVDLRKKKKKNKSSELI